MPSMPMSSTRPMKGEMKAAPALAASSAWLAEKHSVTLTGRPCDDSARHAFSPSKVGGDHLGRDRAVDEGADFLRHLDDAAARLEDQRRVGGDAVHEAEFGKLADFLGVGGIEEELHGFHPCTLGRRVLSGHRRAPFILPCSSARTGQGHVR
jgi:hypothetical protein